MAQLTETALLVVPLHISLQFLIYIFFINFCPSSSLVFLIRQIKVFVYKQQLAKSAASTSPVFGINLKPLFLPCKPTCLSSYLPLQTCP
jgi:hypothetical protein